MGPAVSLSPEIIGAIFTGLTGLVAALAAIAANRSRRTADEQKFLRRRVRKLERWVLSFTAHTFELERAIVATGGRVPERPPELADIEDEDEDDPTPVRSRGTR